MEHTGRVVGYTYDNLYRLTQEAITDPVLGNETISYTYDANDRLLIETSSTYIYTYTYDANGNANGNTLTKSDGSNIIHYYYDYENRLIQIQEGGSQTDYEYDADGIRVSSKTDGDITNYLVDKTRPYAQVLEERDGLGSLTDQAGATANNYLYTGEQYDPNSGFYYLRARYYDQGIGRFVTTDPWEGNIFEPISIHKYLYANSNPVMYKDPGGLWTLGNIMFTVGISSVVAGIIIPDLREAFLRSAGCTENFGLQFRFGGDLGYILYGGAVEAFIWEEAPSKGYCPRPLKLGHFTVYMFGLGIGVKGGAAAGGGFCSQPITFQTPTKRRLELFEGIGRMTSIAGTGVIGSISLTAIHLPDGKYLETSFGVGLGIGLGVAAFSVLTIWDLVYTVNRF